MDITIAAQIENMDKFIEFISALITTCEKVKSDMRIVKADLRIARRQALEIKRKAEEQRAICVGTNIAFGVASITAIIFSGGLALPILLGTGQLVAGICGNAVQSEYEANTDGIVNWVDRRSRIVKQRAHMVINKRLSYEKSLKRLTDSGIEENQAIFYTICGLINELKNQSDKNCPFMTNGETQENMGNWIPNIRQKDLLSIMSDQRNVGVLGVSMASAEKYWNISRDSARKLLPEWLTNSGKSLAAKLPKFAPGIATTAASILYASYDVVSSISFFMSKNKAVEVIDETTELLDEGETSLDVFIQAFTTLRVHALQQLKESKEKEKEEAIKMIQMQQVLALAELEKLKSRNTTITVISISVVSLFFAFLLALIKL